MVTENTHKCHSVILENIRIGMFEPNLGWSFHELDYEKVTRIDKTLAEIENNLNFLTKTDSTYSEKLSKLINQGQLPPKSNWVARNGYKLKSAVSATMYSLHNKSTSNLSFQTNGLDRLDVQPKL